MLGKMSKIPVLELDFKTKRMLDLSDTELRECSELFSSSYGKYNELSEIRPGEQVSMGVNHYRRNYMKPDRYIAMARYQGSLVGHALYIRKNYPECGKMTWVLHLVVDDRYRKQGIASTLLRSIWGFSDDYAWGLATANPCTVRTLESATFRKCKPMVIKKYLKHLKAIAEDTTFVSGDDFVVSDNISQVNSRFFIDNSDFVEDKYCEDVLGKLRPGHEWLAFTFQEQEIQLDNYRKHFDEFVLFSEKALKEAYSRMQMESHGWTKGTSNECDFMVTYMKGTSVIDFGCGIGRHCIELAGRGYDTFGIDFSSKHIETALAKLKESDIDYHKCTFAVEDIRNFKSEKNMIMHYYYLM